MPVLEPHEPDRAGFVGELRARAPDDRSRELPELPRIGCARGHRDQGRERQAQNRDDGTPNGRFGHSGATYTFNFAVMPISTNPGSSPAGRGRACVCEPGASRAGVSVLLDGKVVIVSGVGPGLGQANARALAREGACVVLAARSADYLDQVRAEIEGAGGAGPRGADQPRRSGPRSALLVDRTIEHYGRLDGLVNNVFRMDVFEPFERSTS